MIDRAHLEALKAKPRSEASFEPGSWDDETNSIGVVWYTGAEVVRYNYTDGEFFLSFDFAGVDLSRYNDGAAVLRDHADYSIKAQLGKVMEGSAKVENGRGVARVIFSRNPEHAGLIADIKAGIIKHVSMGTEIDSDGLVYLSKAGVAGAVQTRIRATKWTPYELSFVPVPANAGAQTFAPATPAGDPPMTTKYEPSAEDLAKITDATLAAEAERRRAIKLSGKLLAPLGADGEKLLDECLDNHKMTAEAALAKFRDARLAWDEGQQLHGAKGTGVSVGADNTTKLGKLAAKALAREMGAKGDLVKLTADEHDAVVDHFGSLDPRRMAENVLTRKGVRFASLSDEATLGRAFEACNIHAAMSRFKDTFKQRERLGEISIDDLPILFGSATELTLMDAYQNAPTTYQAWCKIVPMTDFRSTRMIDFSRLPDLEEIGESGKPVEGTVSEAGESLSLKEYGRALSFSRRSIINDKWGVIGQIIASVGGRVAYKRNALAYAKLVANPTLTSVSNQAVFHSSHGNVGTTGALSATTLAELRKKIREQKLRGDAESSTNGMRSNASMQTLVIGATLELTAEQLLSASYVPTSASGVMPGSLRSLQVVTDAEITSATAFYGFADKDQHPCFVETVLGSEGILSDMVFDEETRGVKHLVRVAHNVQAVHYRGAAYNAGA